MPVQESMARYERERPLIVTTATWECEESCHHLRSAREPSTSTPARFVLCNASWSALPHLSPPPHHNHHSPLCQTRFDASFHSSARATSHDLSGFLTTSRSRQHHTSLSREFDDLPCLNLHTTIPWTLLISALDSSSTPSKTMTTSLSLTSSLTAIQPRQSPSHYRLHLCPLATRQLSMWPSTKHRR